MKKLIIIAAVAMSATFASAAQASWSFTKLSQDPSNKGFAYSAYLCDASVMSVALVSEALASGKLDVLETENLVVKQATTAAQGTTGYGRLATQYTDNIFTAGTDYSLYMIILNNGVASDYFYASKESTAKAPEQGYLQAAAFGDLTTSLSAGTWSAIETVPEPTSGLLLLLGMAGLALKRKIA